MEKRTVTVNSNFGRLTVVGLVLGEKSIKLVECMCACGTKVFVKPWGLLSGNNKSCGCLKKTVLGNATRTHGKSNSRTTGYKSRAYGVWQAMRDRCNNPKRSDYKYYGGRGVSVCERWQTFANFFADMGEPSPGLTLDRIDGSRGYTPDNCRWASRKEQVYNSRRVVLITHGKETHSITEWCNKLNIKKSLYYYRCRKGMQPKTALGLEENVSD